MPATVSVAHDGPSSTAQGPSTSQGLRSSEPRPSSVEAEATSARGVATGRALAIARRRAQSSGKQALQALLGSAASGRDSRSNGSPAAADPSVDVAPSANGAGPRGATAMPGSARSHAGGDSGSRDPARERRAAMSQRGRGDAPPAAPSRAPRALNYAPKVVASTTHLKQVVTGLRIGRGGQMTGDEPGADLPVSGTQYIGIESGTSVRSGGPKVGRARTALGSIVSGTLLRSKVHITGDEAGGTKTITGESDQHPDDDLTERTGTSGYASAQFQRQADPHGRSVFGTNLGRSAGAVGSRQRDRAAAIETSLRGQTITGSAVGRTSRVSGDEAGACRMVTGDQYLTPAERQAECGGTGGGTAHPQQTGAMRRDPITGAKVSAAQTWAGQRVTGVHVEHDARVTGDAPGTCSLITGTPYHGAGSMQDYCPVPAGEAARERLPRRQALAGVTGDTPIHDADVTGLGRGATRGITGTRYYADAGTTPSAADDAAKDDGAPGSLEAVGALDARFSVRSPQRMAHLQSDRAAIDAPSASGLITGSFAVGDKKVTGNLEFAYKPRHSSGQDGAKAARMRVSGEGRSAGQTISGYSYSEHGKVTGTEGFTAAERNPSERSGKPQAFAGSGRFKTMAKQEERKQLVTGMAGWSSSTAAKVTLSGGAHG